MVRRALAAASFAALLISVSAAPASAQDRLDLGRIDFSPAAAHVSTPGARLDLTALDQRSLSLPIPPVDRPRGSALLASLYAATAVMQALDVHSTMKALEAGAVEANPLMSGVTKNRGAFMAAKAAVAAGTVFAVQRIAKRNKVAAIVTAVAINGAYAMVVRHNYKIARGR
jgi:hypothetical protein